MGPEEIWVDGSGQILFRSDFGGRPPPETGKYVREDLIETLKKPPLEHGNLEEEDYYPTTLQGVRTNFEGGIIKFSASEIDVLAEQFYNGNRNKLRHWLKGIDEEYLTKQYDDQVRYKTDIATRLALAQRKFGK